METESMANVLQNLAEQFLAMMKQNNQLLEANLRLMKENNLLIEDKENRKLDNEVFRKI